MTEAASAAVLPLAEMLADGSRGQTRSTGRAERVVLPPLQVGRHMLARLTLHEEPAGASWRDAGYVSVNPFVARFSDVSLHGPAGIVRNSAGVVAETLWQTDERCGYARRGSRIVLAPVKVGRRFRRPVLSLLGGNHDNFYHWTLECLGRLAAADAEALDGVTAVLVPAAAAAFQAESLTLAGVDQRWRIVTVPPGEVLHAENLVLPWTMTAQLQPHPDLRRFFTPLSEAGLAAAPVWPGGSWPRRLYVDRRSAANRPLLGEAALVSALASRGFVALQLERWPLAVQIGLFAHARAIVAPHGAALANLLHAAPGCCVLELLMDGWASACFRRLCAICSLRYDCVVGRQLPEAHPQWVHARPWHISLMHVMAALNHMLGD